MLKVLLFVILLGLPVAGFAQDDWQQTYRQLSDVEDVESEQWEEAFELLSDLEREPIDINSASREELEALPFLTDQQVEEIMASGHRHGELLTPAELQMIRSLDYAQRQLLLQFISFGQRAPKTTWPRLDSLLRWGKQEVTASLRVPFYQRRGDRNGYLGYRYRHTVRYKFRCGQRLQFGLTGAQDAGEPFMAEGNWLGYDHYAWYLVARQLGRIETLAVGQYRLSFGMGLVMNGGFSLGKLTTLQNLGRTANAIRANSSRMESGYLQGVAVTVDVGGRRSTLNAQHSTLHTPHSTLNAQPSTLNPPHLTLTAYASLRPIDATLNTDGTAATLLTSGYHRTQAEMQKKHNMTQTDAGLHLDFRRGGLRLGATAAYTHLSRRLQPDTKAIYRRHYPAGTDFLNAAVDYHYLSHRLSLNGETAIDGNGALATINSVGYQPSGTLSVMALQRFYSYRYAALHARSFAEGSRTQNESGLYLGATWKPLHRLQLSAYTDLAYFAWPKYLVSQSSYAWDNMVSGTYTRRNWTLMARYRLHLRQRDNKDKTTLLNRTEHRGRLTFSATVSPGVTLYTQADGVRTDFNSTDFGLMVSQRVNAEIKGIKIAAGVGYFHTDSYEARLYLYEQAPTYQFSFPMLYGEGLRYWLLARARPIDQLTLTAKLGVTNFFDRATIGTDKQLIDHSSMTDLDLQVTYKF